MFGGDVSGLIPDFVRPGDRLRPRELVDRARAKGRTAPVVERDDVSLHLQSAHADATLASRSSPAATTS
jgi:hypothetical protein